VTGLVSAVDPGMAEDPFEDILLMQGRMLGWRGHAERRSRSASGRHATAIKGDQGWPDVVLAHPWRGLVIVELKSHTGSFGPGQPEWLSLLAHYSSADVLVAAWRPADWPFIQVCLRHGVAAYRSMLQREGPLPSIGRRRHAPDMWPHIEFSVRL
jgi:hypothetical protein